MVVLELKQGIRVLFPGTDSQDRSNLINEAAAFFERNSGTFCNFCLLPPPIVPFGFLFVVSLRKMNVDFDEEAKEGNESLGPNIYFSFCGKETELIFTICAKASGHKFRTVYFSITEQ